MAKARESRGDAKSESKTPIIVAMVLFVLLSLGLGTMLYLSYDEKAVAKEAEKKAVADKAAADKLKVAEQEKVLMYRAMLGLATPDNLESLKNAREKNAVIEEYTFVSGQLEARTKGLVTAQSQTMPGTPFDVKPAQLFSWPAGDAKTFDAPPTLDVFAAVVTSLGRQVLADAKQRAAEKSAKDAVDVYTKQAADFSAAAARLNEAAKKFPADLSTEVAAAKALVTAEIAKFEAKTNEYKSSMLDNANRLDEREQANSRQANELKGLNEQVKRIREKEEAARDNFAHDSPHGKVTRRDGNRVYINLGSADKLKVGTTFVVQPSDAAERGVESRRVTVTLPNGEKATQVSSKGTIEVTEVVGPNFAEARVVSQSSEIRNAILTGDLLYNAAWRKGVPDHVALFGVFDMTANGTDDLPKVVKDLTNMGIVVDAYYDLAQRKWVGQVLPTTTYAVEGYHPVSTTADGLSAAKASVEQALTEAKKLPAEKAVAFVKARDFFPRIGYPMRLDVTPDLINRAYARYLTTAAPAAPAEGATPPAGN